MSIEASAQPPVRHHRANVVAIGMRTARGWSQLRLAEEFQTTARRLGQGGMPGNRSTIVKEISRVECGRIAIPDGMYLRLWCETFGCDASELFGHLDAPTLGEDGRATYAVTSHKFIPAYVGSSAVKNLTRTTAPVEGQWSECHIAHVDPSADVYVWPFGVAILHLREGLELRSIAELAAWRRRTYPESRAWADRILTELAGAAVTSPYILSAYWLDRAKWSGETLDTAMRLLSMPSVLLDREGDGSCDEAEMLSAAEMVERELLRDGAVERADLVPFGARGVSIGYASWSSIAYHPVAARRALSVEEMTACELMVQAIWCYTHEILRQVEQGLDPVVSPEYGWRFLRAVGSRLTAPRALETGQHNSMRDAILATSRLPGQLKAATDALRENGD